MHRESVFGIGRELAPPRGARCPPMTLHALPVAQRDNAVEPQPGQRHGIVSAAAINVEIGDRRRCRRRSRGSLSGCRRPNALSRPWSAPGGSRAAPVAVEVPHRPAAARSARVSRSSVADSSRAARLPGSSRSASVLATRFHRPAAAARRGPRQLPLGGRGSGGRGSESRRRASSCGAASVRMSDSRTGQPLRRGAFHASTSQFFGGIVSFDRGTRSHRRAHRRRRHARPFEHVGRRLGIT